MVFLTDNELKELIKSNELRIEPFDPYAVNSISIDLKLGTKFTTMMSTGASYLDPAQPAEEITTKQKFSTIEIDEKGTFILNPGEFVLGTTKEKVVMPKNYLGILHGRSSLGRLGILVFCSGGFVDPGFNGHLVLEIFNASKVPVILRANMTIAKLAIQSLRTAPSAIQPNILQFDKADLWNLRKLVEEKLV